MPFYCRLSKDCYDKLKYQAKKERYSMAGLTEQILREALRKRNPGSISNEIIFAEKDHEIDDLRIAEKVDKLVKANEV